MYGPIHGPSSYFNRFTSALNISACSCNQKSFLAPPPMATTSDIALPFALNRQMLSALHTRGDMARAVIEGITYSLYESICLLRAKGKAISEVVAIGGGAKNDFFVYIFFYTPQSIVDIVRGCSDSDRILAQNR